MPFVKHPDTTALESRLRKLEVGQAISWGELSDFIGADCSPQGPAYQRLRSAINALLRDRIVIGTERGFGVKRMSDADIAEHAQQDVAHVRRAARKSLTRLASVREFGALTDQQKQHHIVASAQLGAIHEFSKPRTAKKLAATANGSTDQLPLAKTLKLFSAE